MNESLNSAHSDCIETVSDEPVSEGLVRLIRSQHWTLQVNRINIDIVNADALFYDSNMPVSMYGKRQVKVLTKDTDASNIPAVEPKEGEMNQNEKQMVEWVFRSDVSNHVTSGTA